MGRAAGEAALPPLGEAALGEPLGLVLLLLLPHADRATAPTSSGTAAVTTRR